MSRYRVDFNSIPWETPMEGLRFRAFRGGDRQLRLVEYTRDMTPHGCEKGHVGYVLDGEFEIQFKRETVVFRAGDGIFIPSGPEHKHMGKTRTDVVRVVFVEAV